MEEVLLNKLTARCSRPGLVQSDPMLVSVCVSLLSPCGTLKFDCCCCYCGYLTCIFFIPLQCFDQPTILEMFKFEVPSLTVGTLDTLMTLSDDLVKTDAIVEQTVRKIEKTTAELFDRKASDLSVGGKIQTRSCSCWHRLMVVHSTQYKSCTDMETYLYLSIFPY
jgi:hypothetical protein